MKAKLGISPIAWSNDDLPELGGAISLRTCLEESRGAGFSGVETGGKFPQDADAIRGELAPYQLQLVSGWFAGNVLDAIENRTTEKARVEPLLSSFQRLGAVCVGYGETAGTIQTNREAALNTRRKLSQDQIRDYGYRLTEFAEYCKDHGVPLAFHHHMGTAIETEQEIDLLMKYTGEAVHLLLDTGHLHFAGGNIGRVIEKHARRILHVHVKDIRGDVLARLDRDRDSFLTAVLEGIFTVPGDGCIDFVDCAKRLVDAGYEGWFVVEAEQDPSKAPPSQYARIGYETMVDALARAGYSMEN